MSDTVLLVLQILYFVVFTAAVVWVFGVIGPPSAAKDFTVTDQDQTVIQQICDTAALNPNLNRELRSGIAAWCVQWDGRMKKANEPPPTEAK